MKFQELREANSRRFASNIFKHDRPFEEEHWALAIAGEAGELANKAKKRFRGGKGCVPDAIFLAEIADIVIYCDLMATHLGVKLEDIITQTFNAKSAEIGSAVLISLPEPRVYNRTPAQF